MYTLVLISSLPTQVLTWHMQSVPLCVLERDWVTHSRRWLLTRWQLSLLFCFCPHPKPCKTAFEGSQQHVQISKVEINVCLLVNREESGVSLKFEEQSEGLSLLCSTGPVAAKVLLPKAWHQSCQRHCRGHLHHRHQRFSLFEQLTCLLAVWHGTRLSS